MKNFYFVLFFILVAIIGVTLMLYVDLILEIDSLQSQIDSLQSQTDSLQSQTDSLPSQIETQPTSKQDVTGGQLFSVDLTSCDLNGTIVLKGTITNNDSIYHSPVMMLYLTDSNNKTIGTIEHIEYDIAPGQTIFIDHPIGTLPDVAGCGMYMKSVD